MNRMNRTIINIAHPKKRFTAGGGFRAGGSAFLILLIHMMANAATNAVAQGRIFPAPVCHEVATPATNNTYEVTSCGDRQACNSDSYDPPISICVGSGDSSDHKVCQMNVTITGRLVRRPGTCSNGMCYYSILTRPMLNPPSTYASAGSWTDMTMCWP